MLTNKNRISYNKLKVNNISNDFKRSMNVFDVACYILTQLPNNECTTMKLHKLLYYCQAWSMVWIEKPLFSEHIEAWANGPVIKELFAYHKGKYIIDYLELKRIANENLLDKEQKEVIDDVIKFYGDKSPQWLIDLTHSEQPWRDARKGLLPNERGYRKIDLEAMQEYYSSL